MDKNKNRKIKNDDRPTMPSQPRRRDSAIRRLVGYGIVR